MKQKIIAGILALTLSGMLLAAPAYAAETIDGEHFDTDYYIATHQYSDAET